MGGGVATRKRLQFPIQPLPMSPATQSTHRGVDAWADHEVNADSVDGRHVSAQ